MHLVSYLKGGKAGFGRLEGDRIIELGSSLRGFLGREGKSLQELLALRRQSGPDHARAEVQLLPPIPDPAKVICIAGNYLAHLQEAGSQVSDPERVTPQLFLKPPSTTLRADGEALFLPRVSKAVDWEVELAVVVGRRGKYIREEEAYDYIAGYTVFNDISERNFEIFPRAQRAERAWDPYFDWFAGKCMDGFAPMGPALVTRDEIPDPQALRITLRLDGVTMQDSSTRLMMTPVRRLVSYISTVMTLEPGDVIATGTPHGVGSARGISLAPGNVMEAEVERLGTLRTPVEREG